MDAGSWIALYAAIVGTAALIWQATTFITERRPKIRVTAALLHILMSAENQKIAAETGQYPAWWLMISIVNVGRSSVWIDNTAIEMKLDEKSIREWKSRQWTLPWHLEPSEIKSWTVRSDEAGALRKGQELRVMVKTGAGK